MGGGGGGVEKTKTGMEGATLPARPHRDPTQKKKKSTEARAKKRAPVRKEEKAKAGSVKKPAADKKEKTEKETEKVRSGKKTEGIS